MSGQNGKKKVVIFLIETPLLESTCAAAVIGLDSGFLSGAFVGDGRERAREGGRAVAVMSEVAAPAW